MPSVKVPKPRFLHEEGDLVILQGKLKRVNGRKHVRNLNKRWAKFYKIAGEKKLVSEYALMKNFPFNED